MTPDHVNGLFELCGALSASLSVARAVRRGRVVGVHYLTYAFITAWGLWNMYYYPSLGQWWSFYGGLALVCVNFVYLLCILILGESNG